MSKEKKSKKLWVGIAVGAFFVLLGGAYLAAYFVAGNQVPAKAVAGGVAIGGLTPDAAEQKLRDELAETYSKPFVLKTGEHSVDLALAESGLSIDYAQTVRATGAGFSWSPVHIFRALAGGDAVDVAVQVDQEKLKQAVTASADDLKQAAVDASIDLSDGTAQLKPAVPGYELNVGGTIDKITEAFATGKLESEPALDPIDPATSDQQAEAFRDGPLKKALSGPVKLTSPNGNIDITADSLPKLLSITGKGEELKVGVDEKALEKVTAESLKKLSTKEPKDASYKLEGKTVVVVPAQSGLVIETKQVADALLKAVEGERNAAIEVKAKEPEFTTEKAEKLKPTKVIGEFTTTYPHSGYRNTNIGQATAKINGTVLLPGETFSMNKTVGERTTKNGFTDGYIINGGVLMKSSGGGVSQAATTLFNAAFFSGYEDVEHKPHSLYFPRYPAGREATVYFGSVDLKFKNNTEYPALIQGFIEPSSSGKKGSVTFRIWSIPTWEKIESSELRRSDYYHGQDRVSNEPNCEPQAPIEGFTVNYDRLFYKNGKVAKSEPFTWKYDAGDRITCA